MHICTLKSRIIFFIPSIENWFCDEVIFKDDNASYHRAKRIKASSSGKADKTNNVASEDSRSKSNWKFMVEIKNKKNVYEKALSIKDLLTAIQEGWEPSYSKLVKSMFYSSTWDQKSKTWVSYWWRCISLFAHVFSVKNKCTHSPTIHSPTWKLFLPC